MAQIVPLKERNKEYYQLEFTRGLPPGTDSIDQFERNPRMPRAPAIPTRPVPELPLPAHRKGKWIGAYLGKLDPETEYDQIVRVSTFYLGSDFNTALGYTAVFIWLTATPAGAAAIHGGKVIKRGHQRYYETQAMNLDWVWWGSGSEETKSQVETINKLHASVWRKVPGAFSHPWEAQMAIILLSWYEEYIRKTVGAKRGIHDQLKKAWPPWGERLTASFRSEATDGSRSFGINYPRDWSEIERFAQWYIDFDFDGQRSGEDRIKGHETAEAFIHQFNELWFPRCLHSLGRTLVLTFIPKPLRVRQELEDPNPVLEYLIKLTFRLMINYGDSQDDPVVPRMEGFYKDLQTWDMSSIDRVETARRDAQTRVISRCTWALSIIVLACIAALLPWYRMSNIASRW